MLGSDLDGQLALLDRLGALDDATFHAWEFGIVQRYRRHEEEQEPIAMAVTRRNLADCDLRERQRIEELLAMLDSAHDPFI
jgi:hypothetical protein